MRNVRGNPGHFSLLYAFSGNMQTAGNRYSFPLIRITLIISYHHQ